VKQAVFARAGPASGLGESGVAVLVAVLGAHAVRATDFHTGWLITVAAGLAAGAAFAALGPRTAPTLSNPATAEATA
jgi:hypothetical protein